MNVQGAYRKMLLDLDKLLRPSDVDSMKFFCSDIIPTRQREGITRAVTLWEVLEERDLLRSDRLDYLKDLIRKAVTGREDLLKIISLFEETSHIVPSQHSTAAAGLKTEFDIVIENINYMRWRILARRLGLSDTNIDELAERYHGNVREQMRQALTLWSQGQNATRKSLITALRNCDMNMIAHQIESS